MRHRLHLLCAVAGLAAGPAPRLAADEPSPARAVFEQAVDSVALLVIPDTDKPGLLTGTLVDAGQRYVLTSNRRLAGQDEVRVLFPIRQKGGVIAADQKKYLEWAAAGRAIPGRVRHRDADRDLAVVQLDRLPDTARAMGLAKTVPPVGATVWRLGAPETIGRGFHVMEGKLRSVGAAKERLNLPGGEVWLKGRIGNMIDPLGPSLGEGGPVVNRDGELVGVALAWGLFNDVTEVRAFLKDNKVTIKELAGETAAPAPKK